MTSLTECGRLLPVRTRSTAKKRIGLVNESRVLIHHDV
jgi:hypothetical protein